MAAEVSKLLKLMDFKCAVNNFQGVGLFGWFVPPSLLLPFQQPSTFTDQLTF